MGGKDDIVSGRAVLGAPEVFQDLAQHPATRVPEHQSRADLAIDRKEVEFTGQPAMIAQLGRLQPGQVLIKPLLGRKTGRVEPLQLGILL